MSGAAFDLTLISYWPWALLASGVAGIAAGIVVRLVQKAGALAVVGGSVEAMLYALLGCAGGLLGGLFFSWLLPSEFYSVVAFILAGVCIFGVILGFMHGTAGIGGKILGTVAYLAFSGVFVLAGVLGWGAERDASFLGWFAGFLALIGATMGILFAAYRSAHWSFGWLLAFVNGSWGALGNLLGFLMHIGSWSFFTGRAGTSKARRVFPDGQRRFFHCWENGMRIMPDYFFTQGPVMTAWTKHGMWHEAVHVFQHYVFGPLMPISYFTWTIVMGAAGAIIGLIKGNGLQHGAFAWGYLNNPWEVWEYASSWGDSTSTPRRVSSSIAQPGQSEAMVFTGGLAWTLTIIYLVAWTGIFALGVVLNAT